MDGIGFLSFLTLFSNIFLIYLLFSYLVKLVFKNEFLWKGVIKFLTSRSLELALLVSITATFGSLYFSEVRGLTPCKFCWLQRIFMYPLPLILGSAYLRKAKDVFYYVLPLSLIGMVLGVYHYYIQMNPQPLAPCSTVGFSVSCSEKFISHFGYITIPFMSLTAFTLISLFMFLQKGKLGRANDIEKNEE
jgi:disulfide bond formation protein DsbB